MDSSRYQTPNSWATQSIELPAGGCTWIWKGFLRLRTDTETNTIPQRKPQGYLPVPAGTRSSHVVKTNCDVGCLGNTSTGRPKAQFYEPEPETETGCYSSEKSRQIPLPCRRRSLAGMPNSTVGAGCTTPSMKLSTSGRASFRLASALLLPNAPNSHLVITPTLNSLNHVPLQHAQRRRRE
jgi:hypothetical protein